MDGFICKFERYFMKKYGSPPRMYNIGILLLLLLSVFAKLYYNWLVKFIDFYWLIYWFVEFYYWFLIIENCCSLVAFNRWYWKSGGDGLYKKVSPLEILILLFYVIKCRHRSFMFKTIFKNNDKIHTLIKDVIAKICNFYGFYFHPFFTRFLFILYFWMVKF